MILVGELALWVALLMAAWGAIVSFAGGYSRRAELIASGERALYATFVCTVLATAGLLVALVTSDFSLEYVASVTSANLAFAYKATALWGGQAGSLLFWTLILSMYGAVIASGRTHDRETLAYVTGTLSAIALFFLATTCFVASPYERLTVTPPDGSGMHPRLQSPAMAVHPPALYLGYVATAIPFAFAIGALLARKVDDAWLTVVRRWTLGSWFFLTIGIVIGMWWAYAEVGWGGFWGWDPVQNGSLLPWLTNTALVHAIVVRKNRGMLGKWIILLAPASFLLVVLAGFITRSGLTSSVHAFAQSDAGYWFAGFLIISVGAVAYLLATRLPDFEVADRLESPMSREGSLVLNNVLLVAIAGWLIVGTLFPLLIENGGGERSVAGPALFDAVIVPLGLLVLAVVGVGAVIAWGRVSLADLRRRLTVPAAAGLLVAVVLVTFGVRGVVALITFALSGFVLTAIGQQLATESMARRRADGGSIVNAIARVIAHDRRRYGSDVVHVGVVVLFVALAGFMFRTEHTVSLGPGETAALVDPYGREWTFTSQGISAFEELNRRVVAVALQVTRDGKPAGLIRSERRQYVDSRGVPIFEPSTEVGIDYSLRQDTYVVLGAETGERADMRIAFNPLVTWLWIGGLMMVLGGVIVMWPASR